MSSIDRFRLDEDDKPEKEDSPALPSKIVEETLFKKRHVLITGSINDKVARATVERLLALSADNDAPINVFISSPGGHVESGDMIHDTMKFITPEIRCIGSGWVASAGALIFIAAEKKNRFCMPNTRFLIHQPSGGVGGSATDIQIQAKQIEIMRARLNRLFSEATGQSIERIEKDMERDYWMNTDEALAYGLLGKVVQSEAELAAATK
ncbi:MAG: ATP-dependent Clp protease proteolytic subunit [Alphaproteobacteria bacterium]|nr:ATP-dependent Clp protease proteolytic subunit [Alphaproteobacteria bacterium]